MDEFIIALIKESIYNLGGLYALSKIRMPSDDELDIIIPTLLENPILIVNLKKAFLDVIKNYKDEEITEIDNGILNEGNPAAINDPKYLEVKNKYREKASKIYKKLDPKVLEIIENAEKIILSPFKEGNDV